MVETITKKDYKNYFKTTVELAGKERDLLSVYMNNQFDKLDQLTAAISKETFWYIFPKILGIDAKLGLLTELLSFEYFSNEDIIRLIENDYQSYFKELCGYDLKMKNKPSIIFHVV